MKTIFISIIVCTSFLWAEPSAFELQSGSTKKEMQSLKGTTELQSDKIFELENQTKQLATSIDGVKSIYEGQAKNINDLNNKVNDITKDSTINKETLQSLQEQIENNAKNIKSLNDGLKEVSDSLNQIKDLLTKIQQQDNVEANAQTNIKNNNANNTVKDSNKNNTESKAESSTDTKTKSTKVDFKKDINKKSQIFKEAKSLTYAKKFDEAIERYNWFIEIDYKKAESQYMLGNIAYAQNKYNDAIYHYKESVMLDDKEKYIPRLLLNCANSLKVLNKVDDAKNFYNSLISRFPDSPEAKEAKQKLETLQ